VKRALHWHFGDAEVRLGVEAWLAGDDGTAVAAETLAESAQRWSLRLRPAAGPDLLVKLFRVASGPHPLRERIKRGLAATAADREWRGLCDMHAAGLAVPAPRGRARLANGDEIVVASFVTGERLDEQLRRGGRGRREGLRALAERVAALHAAGFHHGDLHPGNVLIGAEGPVLVDLQRSGRACWRARAHRRDLARLDFSLAGLGVSLGDRLRTRRIALGLGPDRSPTARRALREVGRLATAAALRHQRNLTRRCLRADPLHPRVRIDGARGLRRSDCSEAWLRAVVASHAEALRARDERVVEDDPRGRVTRLVVEGRDVVVKESPRRGLARRIADLSRGSPARRGWRGGHGLRIRGIDAAEPLAYLESRRLGLPERSWLILEAVGRSSAGDPPERAGPTAEDLATGLCRLLVSLHRAGVVHGDLKASNLRVERRDGALRLALVDLESVRFASRLSDRQRRLDLAQLNASLPDEILGGRERRLAFERYARQLPFESGPETALSEIVRESLARRHRWQGTECAGATRINRAR